MASKVTRKEVQEALKKPLPTTQPARDQAIDDKAKVMDQYIKDNPEGG